MNPELLCDFCSAAYAKEIYRTTGQLPPYAPTDPTEPFFAVPKAVVDAINKRYTQMGSLENASKNPVVYRICKSCRGKVQSAYTLTLNNIRRNYSQPYAVELVHARRNRRTLVSRFEDIPDERRSEMQNEYICAVARYIGIPVTSIRPWHLTHYATGPTAINQMPVASAIVAMGRYAHIISRFEDLARSFTYYPRLEDFNHKLFSPDNDERFDGVFADWRIGRRHVRVDWVTDRDSSRCVPTDHYTPRRGSLSYRYRVEGVTRGYVTREDGRPGPRPRWRAVLVHDSANHVQFPSIELAAAHVQNVMGQKLSGIALYTRPVLVPEH